MTVDYRRGLVKGRYLSDGLTRWYGAWSNFNFVQSIAYDDLPPEPGVLARLIFDSPGGASATVFVFNKPQNTNGMIYDFWVRKTGAVGNMFYYLSQVAGVYQYYKSLGALPAVWTKYSVPVPDLGAIQQGSISRLQIPIQTKELDITMNIAGAYRIELAGVNFRRP